MATRTGIEPVSVLVDSEMYSTRILTSRGSCRGTRTPILHINSVLSYQSTRQDQISFGGRGRIRTYSAQRPLVYSQLISLRTARPSNKILWSVVRESNPARQLGRLARRQLRLRRYSQNSFCGDNRRVTTPRFTSSGVTPTLRAPERRDFASNGMIYPGQKSDSLSGSRAAARIQESELLKNNRCLFGVLSERDFGYCFFLCPGLAPGQGQSTTCIDGIHPGIARRPTNELGRFFRLME